MPKLKPPKFEVAPAEEEEDLEPIPSHQTWSGSISIGLVNIPVRAIPITLERKISFRMLHQKCKTPISYKLFYEEGDEVSKTEIAYGYKVKGSHRESDHEHQGEGRTDHGLMPRRKIIPTQLWQTMRMRSEYVVEQRRNILQI
jgi:hypothetical protein